MMKYYTGIGSRETPDGTLIKMTNFAKSLDKLGYTLRSGGAEGADTAFETGTTNKEIYLPWKGFNNNTSELYNPSIDAYKIAASIHPAWDYLSDGTKKLHARNIHQVLGIDLKTPSEFVICWTRNGKEIGGTATAIKLAKLNNIPVYNLYFTESLTILNTIIYEEQKKFNLN